MKMKCIISVGFLFFEICHAHLPFLNTDLQHPNNTDAYLTTTQAIRKFGYPAESHIVETADGYLLELHRIKLGKYDRKGKTNQKPYSNKYPVLFVHGIFGSSGDFILPGPDKGLPFLLANLGFDIWLLNVRGNQYSKAHVNMTPDDTDFWNFSFHECAVYDVPASIDFICDLTKKDQVIYIGYSMGTTIYFVLTSMLPQFNDKIKLSINFAPSVFFKYIRSPLFTVVSRFAEIVKPFNELIFNGELLPGSDLFLWIRKLFFETTCAGTTLYSDALALAFGYDPVEFNKTSIDSVLARYPVGFSMKGATHYSQLVKSGKFQQYDYGFLYNKKYYGTLKPPQYKLNNVKAPTFLYVGKNDILATVKDAYVLASRVHSIKAVRVLKYPLFAHLDFVLAKHVKELLYDLVIDDLTTYLDKN